MLHLPFVSGIDVYPRQVRFEGYRRRFDSCRLVDLLLVRYFIEKIAQRRVGVTIRRERCCIADVLEVFDEFLANRHVRAVIGLIFAFPLAPREGDRHPF
ncbi:hypothetical protein B1756_13800 [Natrarchaeobaculum aegyptiacum]|uniref:Uncharacterized protein n=1 Tax=Natrarchaeobaculum aegyptiacum TaxID=745377 RepID=A0A2Z2HY81_9EURY|nr:hypothetical protein B1756_13800 [Natrarchaeobaculum aegyptiacum]